MCYDLIASLSVVDGSQTEQLADGSSSSDNIDVQKSGQSPALLTVTNNPPVRGSSPTFRAVQNMDSGVSTSENQSATRQPVKDGEEMRYQGYSNPHKQSRSFKMLEQGLRMSGQGVCSSNVCFSVTMITVCLN